jgi:mono/diheme cytochrome c family protein
MKRIALTLVIMSFAQPAQAQLFRRLFGGRQEVHCAPVQYAQPYYAPTYYQPNYVAVAAIPLATVPVAVDLQAYQYSLNAAAFQSFREYQSQKTQSSQQGQEAVPAGDRLTVVSGSAPSGVDILRKSCIQCHQAGRSPKSGFAIFDESGALAQNLPLHEMAKRMLSEDPETRMPPKGQVPTHDILAVMRLALEGVPEQPTRVAKNEVPISPFD